MKPAPGYSVVGPEVYKASHTNTTVVKHDHGIKLWNLLHYYIRYTSQHHRSLASNANRVYSGPKALLHLFVVEYRIGVSIRYARQFIKDSCRWTPTELQSHDSQSPIRNKH